MKHIKSFKVFESQSELEFLNETRFYFLTNFHKAIKNAPDEFFNICNDLLNLYGEEIDDDITFVDIEDKNLSYTTQRNITKEYPEFIDGLKSDKLIWIPTSKMSDISNDLLDSKTRGRIKIGRFLNKVINTPKKYPESLIDKFVVYLQSKSSAKEDYKFKVVKGNEIAKYYDSFNYANLKGTLGNSCMNDKQDGRSDRTTNYTWGTSTVWGTKGFSNIFDIYTKNPEVCNLLVMLDSSNKLVARALIWNIKIIYTNKRVGPIKFLDRIYSTEDWMVYSMIKWAKENGMATRVYNGLGSQKYIEYKGHQFEAEMEVPVKKIHYGAFPYLDTFIFYDVKEGKLLNYSGKNGLGLQSTSGNYGTATGYSPRVRNFIRKFK